MAVFVLTPEDVTSALRPNAGRLPARQQAATRPRSLGDGSMRV